MRKRVIINGFIKYVEGDEYTELEDKEKEEMAKIDRSKLKEQGEVMSNRLTTIAKHRARLYNEVSEGDKIEVDDGVNEGKIGTVVSKRQQNKTGNNYFTIQVKFKDDPLISCDVSGDNFVIIGKPKVFDEFKNNIGSISQQRLYQKILAKQEKMDEEVIRLEGYFEAYEDFRKIMDDLNVGVEDKGREKENEN